MIFQALGAKYTLGAALSHIFAHGTPADSERLKQALAARYGGKVVLQRKGRAALAQAIRLATGGQGSVAISALTCYSVVQAVEAAGCIPVYVDIREEDLQFGAEAIAAALQRHTDIRAVVVQNMLGIPADITAIQQVARQAGIPLIEDLAHSAGAAYADGHEVGTVGDIMMLSFGRDKAIDTVNGGALIVRTGEQVEEVVQTAPRGFDQLRDRMYPLIAWTARALYPVKLGPYVMAAAIKLKLVVRSADGAVDTAEALPHWQAKLALRQVNDLAATAASRRAKAEGYKEMLDQYIPKGVQQLGAASVRVPLLVSNRDEVVAHLRAHGVQANDIWYDVPVSPARFYSKVQYPEAECPVAVRVASRLVNLPTHERITPADIEYIAKLVREVAKP